MPNNWIAGGNPGSTATMLYQYVPALAGWAGAWKCYKDVPDIDEGGDQKRKLGREKASFHRGLPQQ